MANKELEEFLSTLSSNTLSHLCYVLELPRSGNKSDKISRLLDSGYGESTISRLARWALFAETVGYSATLEFYKEQLRDHRLPVGGSKEELMWRLIENHVFEPRAVLQSMRLDDVREGYYAILDKVSTLPAEQTVEAILQAYGFTEEKPPSPSQVAEEEFGFVLMPFREDMEGLYREVIRPTVETAGFACLRADDLFTTNRIMDDIEQFIGSARFIIADLSGRNPNVFYEVGMSHAWRKKVILLAQRRDDVPFDVRQWRLIVYTDDEKGRRKLSKSLSRTIETITRA